MALRTIQLRLVVPRKPEKNQKTLALWTTHDVINGAAAYYERQLVLMRQDDYETENGIERQNENGDKHGIEAENENRQS